MEQVLGRYSSQIHAILRIVAGLLYCCHGAQKLFGAFGSTNTGGGTLMLIAGIIEFFGGLLIATGFLARYAAFLCSGEMAAGYFMFHAQRGFWPIRNGGELAVILAFLFLYFAAQGPGVWSVDALLKKRAG